MGSIRRIGAYEIVGLLGRGAMGEVYRVSDSKMFGRPAALKVLLPLPGAGETAQNRFQREIEVVSRLQHPNIITVYDWI